MVGHKVDNDLETTLVSAGDQLIKSLKIPKQRGNISVIGDIVSKISHRGGVERGKPNRIDAQSVADVIQFLNNTSQITATIAGGVFEAARIDLVDHPGLPPEVLVLKAHETALYPDCET